MRSLLIPKRNKKGIIGIILFFSFLFLALIIGFIAVIGVGVVDMVSDEVTPIMQELGMVGDVNLSEAADYTFKPANTFIQSLPWLVALGYIAALIFSIVFAMSYSYTANPAFIGFYFLVIILLIFGAIIISNAYQDIYTANDELASRLQENYLMSYMILYSPFILALIAFITGIYLFAGKQSTGGDFGV